jgi:predicted Zn-dependent protease
MNISLCNTLLQSRVTALLCCSLLCACATSPLGRSQVVLYSEQEMRAMGEAAFAEMRREVAETESLQLRDYVNCVASAITSNLGDGTEIWEVVVFDDESVNAFALPGGKIGVYTGLLDVAESQDQLATVIGHEVGHVQARHANERVSTNTLAEVGTQVVATISGSAGPQRDRALAALGLGVQVGVLLPFGRSQEQEADLIGLDLMAQAGFDPEASITLWQNMASRAETAPPELLSTHPASGTRIEALQERMPLALQYYSDAVRQSLRPECDNHRPPEGDRVSD